MMRTTFAAFLLTSTVFSSPVWATINAADFGLSESASDNAAALQRAFNAAAPGEDVVIPSGSYAYGSPLTIDGVKVRGSGNTVLKPTNPVQQRIVMTGNAPSLSGMQIDYKPVMRSGKGVERAGVWVDGARGFNVSGLVMDGAAYGVPSKGGGGNIFVKNSTGGAIRDNFVNYALADSIHITNGSSNIDVTGNKINGSNDDSIAVVDYGGGAGNVRIDGNTITNNRWGRGVTAVGANDVRITNNYIKGNATDGAGVYIASEPAYNTAAPRNILVEGNQIQDTGGPGKGHGQIMLWSGKGPINGVTIKDNEVRDSKRSDLAVVLSGSMSNVSLEGNSIDGEISRRGGGGYADGGNTTNDPAMVNAAPVPPGTPTPMGRGGGGGSGGDPIPGGDPLAEEEDGGLGTVLNNAGNVGSCSGAGAASSAAASIGGISSIFSGGRSTAPLQIAQQIQLVAQRICQTEQLMAQIKMLKGTDWGNQLASANGINAAAQVLMGGRQVYNMGSVTGDYGKAYPTVYGGDLDNEEMIQESNAMLARQRQAQIAAEIQQAASAASIQQRPRRVAEIMASTRNAPGQTAAIQENVKMGALLVESISTLHSDIIATERARVNEMARVQQDRALEQRTFENAMVGWGECQRCGRATVGWEK